MVELRFNACVEAGSRDTGLEDVIGDGDILSVVRAEVVRAEVVTGGR